MKKVSVLLILLILSLVGCKEREVEYNLDLNLIKIELNEDIIEISIEAKIGNFPFEKIKKIGVLYGLEKLGQPLTKENSLKNKELDFSYSLDGGKYKFTFEENDEENYNTNFKVKAYLILDDNEIKYFTKTTTFNLYELAKLKDSNYAIYLVKYVEGKIIEEVKIKVDYKKYTVEALGEGYEASLKTDYNTINFTIELNPDYIINDDIKFIVNEVIIESTKYEYKDNTIKYEVDDPNWTRPY